MSYIGNSPATSTEVADNAITLAKMASGTDGNLITYDASGDPAYVTTGTSGQVLTSGGAGVAPTFQTAAAGGKVLKFVAASTSSSVVSTTSTYVDTGITATITPTSASSTIYIMITINGLNKSSGHIDNRIAFKVFRDATQIDISYGNLWNKSALYVRQSSVYSFEDSPATTSATTYKVQFVSEQNTSLVAVQADSNSGKSTITLMEIGA